MREPSEFPQIDDLRFALAAVDYLQRKHLDREEIVSALVEELELAPDVARALVLTHRVAKAA